MQIERIHSHSIYSYVGNNPLSRTDPDGHCTNGGQQKGFFWCLFNDSDQDAQEARQQLLSTRMFRLAEKNQLMQLRD